MYVKGSFKKNYNCYLFSYSLKFLGYLEGGFTKCQFCTQKPERKAVKIPKQFMDVSILGKYK